MINLNQDDGVTPVQSQNQNWFQIGSIYFASTLLMVVLSVGGLIASMSDFWTVAIGIIIGVTILVLVGIGSGFIARHTKLGIAYSSKFTFGRKGAYIVASIMALSFLGWYGVELEIFAKHFGEITGLFSAQSLASFWLVILLMGITVIIPATIGFHSFKKCAIGLVLILFPIILGFIIISKHINFPPVLLEDKFTGKSLGSIISLVIGTWAAGYMAWGDYLRFAKSKRTVIAAPFFAGFLGFGFMLFAGVLLSRATGEYDIAKLMAAFGGVWSLLGIVWLSASTWMINLFALYIATLASASMVEKIPRWKHAIILGLIAIFLALLGITKYLVPGLLILGVTMPPILAVIAVDFFIFKRKEYVYSNLSNVPNFRWHSLVSWIIGSSFGFLTYYKIFSLTSSSAIDAIITAVIVHFIIMLYKA